MKRIIVAAALLVFILSISTAYAEYPMKVKDSRGKIVTIKSKPQRIVALAPNITEILYAIGAQNRVVGVNRFSEYPAAAKKKPSVGDMNINTEAVVALKPDLVIAHGNLNNAAISRLDKLGLTVFSIDPKSISEVIRDIRTIGKITARPKSADSVAKKMENSISSIQRTCAGKKIHRKVLVAVQSNPLWAAGPKTYIDEMIKLINSVNVANDARPGFVTFSKEKAITRNPDVIIVGMKSDINYFLKDPAWKKTNAAKNKRVYVIDNDLLVRPGPRLTAGLKELAAKVNF